MKYIAIHQGGMKYIAIVKNRKSWQALGALGTIYNGTIITDAIYAAIDVRHAIDDAMRDMCDVINNGSYDARLLRLKVIQKGRIADKIDAYKNLARYAKAQERRQQRRRTQSRLSAQACDTPEMAHLANTTQILYSVACKQTRETKMQHAIIKTTAIAFAALALTGCGTGTTTTKTSTPRNPVVDMQQCDHEDGSGQHLCTWYADQQGNKTGVSVTNLDGKQQCVWTTDGADCYSPTTHKLVYSWLEDGQCHLMRHAD